MFALTIVLAILGGWLLVGLALALFIGRAVKIADKRRTPASAASLR